MERTTEIPPQGWFYYFESLSRRALSHPMRVEVESADLGDQELARGMPLRGISVESKGTELGDIEISLGDERQLFNHRVIGPLRVFLAIDADGNLDCVFIEDRGGAKTLVFFEGGVSIPAWSYPGSRGAEPSLGV